MYIEQSRFRGSVRVRLVKKVLVDGAWKKQLVTHIGTAQHELDIGLLLETARKRLDELRRGDQLTLSLPSEAQPTSRLQNNGEYWQLTEQVLGGLYDRLGITTTIPLLRPLVIARIVFPRSKLQTANWLTQHLALPCHENQLYRAMDAVAAQQSTILANMRCHITASYPRACGYVLYDVTTLYFETEQEDEDVVVDNVVRPGLRKKGYSKDHRGDLPQVVLGLAVNALGMPLSYQLHSGDTYEGHTLLSGIEVALSELNKSELTVVADAGMLNAANLKNLEEHQLTYIVGARLRSLSASDQAKILKLDFNRLKIHDLQVGKRRLVVSYSEARSKRAKALRERSVARLERLIAKGTAVRKHSYLDFTVKEQPTLNQTAIDAAAQWDGIKGYVTNTTKQSLKAQEVIAHYTSLYRVEQSFRLTKTDLRVRPAFHYKSPRIQAHVVICMIALTLLRILEQEAGALNLTLDQAIQEITAAKAAMVSLNGQAYLVPPALTPVQAKFLRCVDLVT